MKSRELGTTGIRVPELSLGAAPFGDVYGDTTPEQLDDAMAAALTAGMNLIDTSPYYGDTRSESALGRCLRGVAREDYVLATKCGRQAAGWDFSEDAIRRSIDASLERLGTDRLDIVQCHDIEEGDIRQVRDEAIPVLRDLQEQGVIGAFGVTGYTLDLLEQVAVEEQVGSVMAYCTYTLQDRRLLDVAGRLRERGIGVFNASPLHMGILTEKGAPEWNPAHVGAREASRRVVELCREAGTRIETVALQFALDVAEDAGISTTVVGTASAANVDRNVAVVGSVADRALLEAIREAFGSWLNVGWDVPATQVSGSRP
ncbi:aldo/keto reductase [Demequina flava]|uniref:aldo/keto reductase n=1 Tax=Demequina flava TaxID=1095025 RepID=UPI0007820FAF|nr:aldo/keto reductase [Demequina flava]